MRLQPRPKRQTSDGGHRALDRSDALALMERHVSPITGIVARLVPGERGVAPEWCTTGIAATLEADHNFSDLLDDRYFLQEGLRRRSGGKGKSPEQVRLSAIGELLERYSGVFDGTEQRRRARGSELGDAAIHPNACLNFSARQYAAREANPSHARKVPPGAGALRPGGGDRVDAALVADRGTHALPAHFLLLLRLPQRGPAASPVAISMAAPLAR